MIMVILQNLSSKASDETSSLPFFLRLFILTAKDLSKSRSTTYSPSKTKMALEKSALWGLKQGRAQLLLAI